MSRLIVVSAVLALGLLALMWWILSGAGDQLEGRNKLAGEDGRHAAKSHRGGPPPTAPPAGMPQTEAFEAVRLALSDSDPRARLGGAVILSLRGNRVAFRRRALGDPVFVRNVLTEARRQEILRSAEALPVTSSPAKAAFTVTLADGKTSTSRTATEAEAAALLALAEGSGSAWTPAAISLELQELTEVPEGSVVQPWPAHVALPDPAPIAGQPFEIRGSAESRTKLLTVLATVPILKDPGTGRTWRIVSWSPVLP